MMANRPDHSEFDDDQPTTPHGFAEMVLTFDDATRTYHDQARRLPDAVDIGAIVLQVARALHGPDARAIAAAGCAEQLHRILGQVAASAGLAVSGAIKDALRGPMSAS